jgi:hypothetical protein
MNPAETSFRQRQYTQFSSHISGLLAESTLSTSSKAEKLLTLFESNYDDDSDAESQVSNSGFVSHRSYSASPSGEARIEPVAVEASDELKG